MMATGMMLLNGSPGVKKTWDGILDLLILSSVILSRSLDSCPNNNNSKPMYSIYFIPGTIVGTSYVLVLLTFVVLLSPLVEGESEAPRA